MEKTIITTILILIMGVGLPATQVPAASESGLKPPMKMRYRVGTKRYGQLEAKAALLKANLAVKTDATGKQARAKLADLLERAAAMLKDEESAK